jgi:hypothetical protein
MKPFATTIATIMACLTGTMTFMPNLLTPKPYGHGSMLIKNQKGRSRSMIALTRELRIVCTTEDDFGIAINFYIKLKRSS